MSRGAAAQRSTPQNDVSARGGHRTRQRILGTALKLFSRNGFHGTSVRSLARAVGLTEAAIYYHFRSKRAIVRALYEERGFMAALDELEHLPGDVPLRQQLAANAIASAHLWSDNADLLGVVIAEVLRGDRAAKTVHRELMDRWLRGILELVRRYNEKGAIDPRVDTLEAATSWVDLMFGAFMDRMLALGKSRSGFLAPEFRDQIETLAIAFGKGLEATEGSDVRR